VAEEITKYENWALEFKNIWKVNSLFRHLPGNLSGRSGHRKLPKISGEYRFNQKHFESGAKTSTITDVS
jgi:hypothetical protein